MGTAIKPQVNDILLHKKGDYYKVLMYGKHSETGETMIVYESIETKGIHIRPLSMFTNDRFTIAIRGVDLQP